MSNVLDTIVCSDIKSIIIDYLSTSLVESKIIFDKVILEIRLKVYIDAYVKRKVAYLVSLAGVYERDQVILIMEGNGGEYDVDDIMNNPYDRLIDEIYNGEVWDDDDVNCLCDSDCDCI